MLASRQRAALHGLRASVHGADPARDADQCGSARARADRAVLRITTRRRPGALVAGVAARDAGGDVGVTASHRTPYSNLHRGTLDKDGSQAGSLNRPFLTGSSHFHRPCQRPGLAAYAAIGADGGI